MHNKKLRERLAVTFINEYYQKHRRGCSLREIQQAVNYRSVSTANTLIRDLSHKGLITYHPRVTRSIVPAIAEIKVVGFIENNKVFYKNEG